MPIGPGRATMPAGPRPSVKINARHDDLNQTLPNQLLLLFIASGWRSFDAVVAGIRTIPGPIGTRRSCWELGVGMLVKAARLLGWCNKMPSFM